MFRKSACQGPRPRLWYVHDEKNRKGRKDPLLIKFIQISTNGQFRTRWSSNNVIGFRQKVAVETANVIQPRFSTSFPETPVPLHGGGEKVKPGLVTLSPIGFGDTFELVLFLIIYFR